MSQPRLAPDERVKAIRTTDIKYIPRSYVRCNMEPLSVAIFDPDAFYPFRSLVQGGLQNWNELQDIERFVRAIVLHDEMSMILEPWPYDPLADEEMSLNEPGARNIIVGMGPVLSNYEGLLSIAKNLKPISEWEVSSTLRDIAAGFSNARPGNPWSCPHLVDSQFER